MRKLQSVSWDYLECVLLTSKKPHLFTCNKKGTNFFINSIKSRSSDEDTKRWGMLYLVNQLLKIYFRINKLHLCKALIRAIDASQFKDQFSLSQQVTYRYYVGRKAIFESDFKSGEYNTTLPLQKK